MQQHTTLKSGYEAWRKMLPKWRWEMVKQLIVGLSRGMLVINVWVEVEDSIEDKVPHNYQETLLVGLPLQGEGVLIREVSGVPISQPWWEGPRESNWARRAGRGLRVKVNLLIFKDEKTKDTVTYHSWQWWDIGIFCHCLGWDMANTCCHMFLGHYKGSLETLPGVQVKKATLTNILQMLDEHYGMVYDVQCP